MILYSSYVFGVELVVCEFGQHLTDAFNEINDLIVTFDWHLFPHKLQQMLPVILMVAQLPAIRENSKKYVSIEHKLCSNNN